MKNYHSLLLAKAAVCFLLVAQPSQAVNPSETDLVIASPLMTEDKVVDEAKISIERDLGVDLGENLTTKDGDLLRSDSPVVKIKGLDTPSLEVAPKIAQSYNPPMGMPAPPNGVMVPNPEIIIKSNGTPNPTIITPTMPMAPTLPRAVAPPVGDMSISNVNSSYDPIDLGPSGRTIIPRLVLRQAPADEVLKVLARYAGVNLVSIDGAGGAEPANGAVPPVQGSAGVSTGNTNISLDIENEPVENVFNSVLMASGLKASRRGNTIFVGKQLPQEARNTITRTIRLNQALAFDAATFLSTQGAQTYAYRQSETVATEVGEDKITRTVKQQTPKIENIELDETRRKFSPLNGLSVSADERLNSVTLVGEPRLITLATTLLTQLDARRRQVAVNVKIVDINLNNIQDYNSSFSFGVGDGYFVQDNGAAVMRFGSTAPVSSNTINSATGRVSNPPAIQNPFSDANTFINFNQSTTVPGYGSGDRQVFIDSNGTGSFVIENPTDATFFGRTAGVSNNPFQTGITELTRGTPNINTITRSLVDVLDATGNIIGQRTVFTSTATPGADANATSSLPSYFQYPKKFQAQINAQIQSGNAKILTDPTLVVQEGQKAEVKLTQSVVASINTQVDPLSGVRTTTPVLEDVGLTLVVVVNRIDDNGFISLETIPIVASPGGQQQFESGPGANNTITLINKRTLASGQLRMRDGQTLILTGIISENQQSLTSKVPILGDIPILGALFRSQSDTTNRSEVVIMLTPQIINDNTESQFGYNYTPSKASADYLRQQGFPVQAQP
jgi:type IV pilus assembly protein PilQ